MMQVELIFRHLLSTVGRMFRRVATGFAIVFLGVTAGTEGIAAALTHDFPPTGLTHVTALALGFAWGLIVALAIAIEEGLRGFITLIEEVVKETEKAAKKIGEEVAKEGGQLLHAAGHEVQNLGHDAGRLVQGVERGAVTAVKDVASLPGRIIGGVEHAGQSVEQRLTGHQEQ